MTGGYTTLNFIPSIATMIFGLMTGEMLRRQLRSGTKFGILSGAGVACLLTAMVLDHYIWPDGLKDAVRAAAGTGGLGEASFFKNDPPWTLCPVVKRLWTPTWAVFSTGWVFLALAAFYGAIDVLSWRRWWTFPLIVVGMNSLGRLIVRELTQRGERTLAIDTDPAKLHGLPGDTMIGNVDYLSVLEEAGLGRAKLIVSAVQIEDTNRLLAFRAREFGVPSSVHAFDQSLVPELRSLGATHLMDSRAVGIERVMDALHDLGVYGS